MALKALEISTFLHEEKVESVSLLVLTLYCYQELANISYCMHQIMMIW